MRLLTFRQFPQLLDGTNLVTRPSRMSLGRVSVVRSLDSNATVGVKGAEQRLAGTPLIDDYIKTPEAVMDYLTRFGTHPTLGPKYFYMKHPQSRQFGVLDLLWHHNRLFMGTGIGKPQREKRNYPAQVLWSRTW